MVDIFIALMMAVMLLLMFLLVGAVGSFAKVLQIIIEDADEDEDDNDEDDHRHGMQEIKV